MPLFIACQQIIVPAGTNAVRTSGYDTLGKGIADYVPFDFGNPIANDAFIAQYPRATFRSVDHRYFRLAMDTISVEMFGAVGDNVANDQPAIQAALDYAGVASIRHLQFVNGAYALWCPRRYTTAYTDHNTDGIPMVVRSSMLLEASGAHATLNFLSHEGLNRTTHWQTPPTPGTNIWRGGGLYLVGNDRTPAAGTPLAIEYFAMRNIKLDGGIDPSGFRGDPNTNNGKGWDQTDKGFRLQDQIVGDIYLDHVELTRFGGELLYGSGSSRSMTTTDCWIHATDGDAYNWADNARLYDTGSRFGEAYQATEIFGGPGSRFVRTLCYDCIVGGGIQGGLIGGLHDANGALLPGTTYSEAQRADPAVIPWFDLDGVTWRDCGHGTGGVQLSNWIRGNIYTVDTSITISSETARTNTCIDLEINAIVDRYNVGTPVFLAGPMDAATYYNGGPRYVEPPAIVSLVIHCKQSKHAASNGIFFQRPLEWSGLLGPDISIILADCLAVHAEATDTPAIKSKPHIERRNVTIQDDISHIVKR